MFEGSSSMSRSGLTNKALANASRILFNNKQEKYRKVASVYHPLIIVHQPTPDQSERGNRETHLHPPEKALVGFS